eukprot:14737-Eustigmatos_ZCMA.PRE.1
MMCCLLGEKGFKCGFAPRPTGAIAVAVRPTNHYGIYHMARCAKEANQRTECIKYARALRQDCA